MFQDQLPPLFYYVTSMFRLLANIYKFILDTEGRKKKSYKPNKPMAVWMSVDDLDIIYTYFHLKNTYLFPLSF